MLMSARGRTARLQYLPNATRMLLPGDHVLCAVSGVAVPLDELRYWSVQRQEAYATAALSLAADRDARGG